MMNDRWRTGRRNSHTLYEMTGPEPGEDDQFVGALLSADHAALAARSVTDLPTALDVISDLSSLLSRAAKTSVRELDPELAHRIQCLTGCVECGEHPSTHCQKCAECPCTCGGPDE